MAKKVKKKAKKKAVSKRSLKKKPQAAKKKAKTKKPAKKKAKKKAKPARGQPPKYKKEFDLMAEQYLARYKGDYKGLAKVLAVSERTIFTWIKDKPSFKAAIERGKLLTASEIEHTLRQLAVPHDEEVVTFVDSPGKKGKPNKEIIFDRKVKKGVVSIPAAKMILAADDPRFSTKITQEGPVIDALANMLKEMDGNQRGIPAEDR